MSPLEHGYHDARACAGYLLGVLLFVGPWLLLALAVDYVQRRIRRAPLWPWLRTAPRRLRARRAYQRAHPLTTRRGRARARARRWWRPRLEALGAMFNVTGAAISELIRAGARRLRRRT